MKRLIIKLFIWAVIRPHYNAIVKRGLINKYTTSLDFLIKMAEEKDELSTEIVRYDIGKLNRIGQESIDLIMVVFNYLIFTKTDVAKELIKNIKTQQKRANDKKI
jgi:NTP pyrophosphatase (non-canonical NTP hydrolase)